MTVYREAISPAQRTQKPGKPARYGPRDGVSVRHRAGKALDRLKRKYTCPTCQYQKVTRKASGIWHCKKCGHTFAGGVWDPYTRASEANHRILRRGVEGATATDMALIAQARALEYEKSFTEPEEDSDIDPAVEVVSEEAAVDDEEE